MRTAARILVAALAAGLLLGVATQFLQGILPGPLNWLANSMSGWLVPAFAVGALAPAARLAAIPGPVLLYGALAGYQLAAHLRFGYGMSTTILLFWSVGAVVGGAVFGLAGWTWRHGGDRGKAAATGLLAALLLAEGFYLWSILPDPATGVLFAAVGLAVPTLIGGSWRGRALGYAALVPCLALGAVGYAAMFVLLGVITGV